MMMNDLPAQRNGRLLCSPRDPHLEAKKWLELYKRDISENKSEKFLILGLGAGFHVLHFIKNLTFKKLTVLETDLDLINQFLNRYKNEIDLSKINILHLSSLNQFIHSSDYKSLISSETLKLSFKPAWQGEEVLYLQALSYLNPQVSEKFKFALEQSGLVLSAQQISESRVHPLHQLALCTDPSDEILIWKCLRELVK
jgi:hypothetical protein